MHETRRRQKQQHRHRGQPHEVPPGSRGIAPDADNESSHEKNRGSLDQEFAEHRQEKVRIHGAGYFDLALADLMIASMRWSSSAESFPPSPSTSAATALESDPSKNVCTTRFSAERLAFARGSVGMKI